MRHRAQRIRQDPCPLVVGILCGGLVWDHVLNRLIGQRMRSVICFALDGAMLKYLQTCSTFWTVFTRSVSYHRNDVCSENFWLSIGIAANTVDLLDEVHVLFLCVLAFTLKRWLPVLSESGSQPEYLGSMFSFMLRNEVEVRVHLEDGRALLVVFAHEVEESRFPKGPGCTDALWRQMSVSDPSGTYH